jgi:hypothetical protein
VTIFSVQTTLAVQAGYLPVATDFLFKESTHHESSITRTGFVRIDGHFIFAQSKKILLESNDPVLLK